MIKGTGHSEATKKKIGDANRGKRRSDETRQKLREAATRRYGDPEKRFWLSVDKLGGPDTCWKWLQGTDRNGYGSTWWYGRKQQTHRVAWLVTFGDIPKGCAFCTSAIILVAVILCIYGLGLSAIILLTKWLRADRLLEPP